MAKTRLAPLKKIIIVRLELNAALLAKRIITTIEKESRFEFECVYSVDSEIVRAMIQQELYGFNRFIGVRKSRLQATLMTGTGSKVPKTLHACSLEINEQIDVSNRGPWQNGPKFLSFNHEQWPLKSSSSKGVLPEQLAVPSSANWSQNTITGNIKHHRCHTFLVLPKADKCHNKNSTSSEVTFLQSYIKSSEKKEHRKSRKRLDQRCSAFYP